MVLRGDGETDPAARLRHYVQAVATAPGGSAAAVLSRRRRASVLLSSSEGRPLTATQRKDLLEAAAELEALGELEAAAEAYGRAGEADAEARCLAGSGDVERLDAVLLAAQGRDRAQLARKEGLERFEELRACGRRRDAVALALASPEEALREKGRAMQARRVATDVVAIRLRGQGVRLVLEAKVVVGRTATLSIASAAVSREHLVIERHSDQPVVRDLGSRNGTTLRGMALAGAVPVGDGLELLLGGQVRLGVRPAGDREGALAIELAGVRYLAHLGPTPLGIGRWRLERAPGEGAWVELVTDDDPPAYLDGMATATHVSLLTGDAFTTERGGDPVVGVEVA